MKKTNADDATLLAALIKVFPPERTGGSHFDHWSISSEIYDHPDLVEALAFLGVKRRKTGWNRGSLTEASDRRIANWLRSIEGRDINGLRADRSATGWFRVFRIDIP